MMRTREEIERRVRREAVIAVTAAGVLIGGGIGAALFSRSLIAGIVGGILLIAYFGGLVLVVSKPMEED